MKKTTEKRPYEKPLMRAVEIQIEGPLTASVEGYKSNDMFGGDDVKDEFGN